MVLRESLWMALAGVLCGLGAALLLARVVKSMLYGISEHDPATLSGAVVLLVGMALAASWSPARRAASIDPAQALRAE